MRETLINQVSADILAAGDGTISSITEKIKLYDNLFEDTIRNYYELKMSHSRPAPCPLFALYDMIEKGSDTFYEEDCDDRNYDSVVSEHLIDLNLMFGTTYILENSKWCITNILYDSENKGKAYLRLVIDECIFSLSKTNCDGVIEYAINYDFEANDGSSGNDYPETYEEILLSLRATADRYELDIPMPTKEDVEALDEVNPMEEF